MTTGLVAILAAVVVTFFGHRAKSRAESRRMRRYFERDCSGRAWAERFPDAKTGEIREFLLLFTQAFVVDQRKKLAFFPDDRIQEIYRTRYPDRFTADMMECETLVAECKRRYGIDLRNSGKENQTLGDIFDSVRRRA